MKITGASLVNRFYIKDGWTKELVADLMLTPDIDRVILRYDTKEVKNDSKPIYYAVYDLSVVFDREKAEQHEYKPFMSNIFEENNKIG